MSLMDFGDLRQKTPDRVWLEIGMERYAEVCREGRIICSRMQLDDLSDAEVRDIVQRVRALVRSARLVVKIVEDIETKLMRSSMDLGVTPASMLVKGGN